jgi:hypothetical protein
MNAKSLIKEWKELSIEDKEDGIEIIIKAKSKGYAEGLKIMKKRLNRNHGEIYIKECYICQDNKFINSELAKLKKEGLI